MQVESGKERVRTLSEPEQVNVSVMGMLIEPLNHAHIPVAIFNSDSDLSYLRGGCLQRGVVGHEIGGWFLFDDVCCLHTSPNSIFFYPFCPF